MRKVKRIFIIIIIHFVLQFVIQMRWFLAPISYTPIQITTSFTHLIGIILILEVSWKAYQLLSKKTIAFVLFVFVMLNMIPITHYGGFTGYTFFEYWEITDHVTYGFPYIFLRLFEDSTENLYAVNQFILNIYILIIVLSFIGLIRLKFKKE